MTWRIRMIKVAESDVRGPEVFWMSEWDKWYTLHYLVGVRTFRTGGHHCESTGICVDTSKGQAVMTDCSFYFENIEQNRMLGIAENLDECRHAYARIRKTADFVIPLYDPRLLERYPAGEVA